MNGKAGEVLGVDASTGRYMVKLDDAAKSIKVKPINCRRIPLASEEDRRRALEKTYEAYRADPLTKHGFQQALQIDRCCVLAHAGLSQMEHMRGNGKEALLHLHRAIAHLYAYEHLLSKRERIRLQMEYATCLGEAGDTAGETEWLETVLQQDPTNCHVIMEKANSMARRGLEQESLDVWFQVLDCPDEHPDEVMAADEVAMVKARSRDSIMKILVDMTHQVLTSDCAMSVRNATFERLLPLYNRILQLGGALLEPDDHIRALTFKGYILAYNSVIFKQPTSWEEGQACFRQARFVPNAAPLVQGMILFYQARAYELRGDNGPRNNRQADYKEAMELLRESEQVHTDQGTRMSFLRLQAKTNQDMVTVTDSVSGSVVAGVVRDTQLESLPQGPTHQGHRA